MSSAALWKKDGLGDLSTAVANEDETVARSENMHQLVVGESSVSGELSHVFFIIKEHAALARELVAKFSDGLTQRRVPRETGDDLSGSDTPHLLQEWPRLWEIIEDSHCNRVIKSLA